MSFKQRRKYVRCPDEEVDALLDKLTARLLRIQRMFGEVVAVLLAIAYFTLVTPTDFQSSASSAQRSLITATGFGAVGATLLTLLLTPCVSRYVHGQLVRAIAADDGDR